MKNVLLLGDSHLGAIKRAHMERPDEYSWLSFQTLGKGVFSKSRFFEADDSLSSVKIIISEWNEVNFYANKRDGQKWPDILVLSMPINTSRILRDFSWHTHVPWRLKHTESEIALSDAFLERLIKNDTQNAIAYAIALKNIGMHVAILEAPRFYEDAPYLKSSRLDVIRYVDTLYRERVRKELELFDLDVINQSPDTISDLGTTKMEYNNERPNDVHHANISYGHIAINQIRNYALR